MMETYSKDKKILDSKDVKFLKGFLLEGPFFVTSQSKAIIRDEVQ